MSNVSYDLDTSGGLMPLIRALIKPPDEETPVHKPKKHPYYKRPGKGHNHDCCDACGEGGDLICCDRCPASFHLGCYDPPLDENDIPAGLWLCKQCRGSDAEKPTSSRSSRAQSPADKAEVDKKSRSHRKKTKEESKEKEREGENEKELENEPKEEKEVNPMEVLVKAARIMNPKQFELPREMQIPCPFPGTEKEGSKTGNAIVITTDGSGCVPLPAKTCYVCTATCKKAPLLQCDYCPLLFHQDCLDPPLTALPTGRWMCPNHVEQYIDWKLVRSVSCTERAALWERFAAPLDQHAVKVDFIRRARGNRPFRCKVAVGVRGRVCVPDMVRRHYRRPPPLLPSRREFVRCAKVLKQLKASGTYDESEEEGEMTEESKHKICMNMSCPQYSGEGRCPLQEEEDGGQEQERDGGSDDGDSCDSEEEMDTAEIVGLTAEPSADQPEQPTESAELHTTEEQNKPMTTSQIKPEPITESFLVQCSKPTNEEGDRKRKADDKPQPKLRLRDTKAINQLVEIAEEQLKDLDMNTIKILAYQMMQQIAASEGIYGSYRNSRLGTWASRALAALGRRERASLQRLGLRLMPLPSELLPPEDRRRIAQHVYGAPDSPAQSMKRTPGEELADRLVRAAFCPVNMPPNGEGEATLGAPVAMRAATCRVGSSGGCDLRLPRACRRVSATHALIFCDEVTQHYELINYSSWGTCVNGTLYAVDVSPRASEPPEQARSVPYRPSERYSGCRCPADGRVAAGAWEGGALLPHASLLQFGCQLYVFCLLDRLHHER